MAGGSEPSEMVAFSERFWGDKHNGYEVLYHQLKLQEAASRDIVEFLRNFSSFEEQFSKNVGRLSKQVAAYTPTSSFAPVWQVFKGSLEKLSSAHSEIVKPWQDLLKEVQKYVDSLSKKHKAIKESEAGTAEISLAMQHVTAALQKSKDTFLSRFAELSRISKQENASAKKVEKAELEFKKATDEYRQSVNKYNTTLADFQSKMRASALVFQECEEAHLRQVLEFFRQYSSVHEEKHTAIGEVHYDFHTRLDALTVQKLLKTVVDTKGTGHAVPEAVSFEDVDRSTLPVPVNIEDIDVGTDASKKRDDSAGQNAGAPPSSTIHINISGIFKKRQKKKKKKKGDTEATMAHSEQHSSAASLPEVDAEGYVIRKDEDRAKEAAEDSWYSSSDDEDGGDKDDAEERTHSRIKVAIKPLEGAENTFDAQQHILASSNPSSSTNLRGTSGSNAPASGDPVGSSPPFPSIFDAPLGSSGGRHTSTSKTPAIGDLLSIDFDSFMLPSSATAEPSQTSTPRNNGEHAGTPEGSTPGPLSAEDREVTDAWRMKETLDVWKGSPSSGAPPPINGPPRTKGRVTPNLAVPNIPRPPSRKDMSTYQRSKSTGDPFGSLPRGSGAAGSATTTVSATTPTGVATTTPAGGGMSTTFGLGASGSNLATTFGVVASSVMKSKRGSTSPLTVATTPPSTTAGESPSSPALTSVPLAVAVTETVAACIKSPKFASAVKVAGEILISFPSTALKTLLLADGESEASTASEAAHPLAFRLRDRHSLLETVHANRELVTLTTEDGGSGSHSASLYTFNMAALREHLASQQRANRAAAYFNIEVIKYLAKARLSTAELSSPATGAEGGNLGTGAPVAPLSLTALWRRDGGHVDFRLDYKYEEEALQPTCPLSDVQFRVALTSSTGVKDMQAQPRGHWSGEQCRAAWKVDGGVGEGADGRGCIRAKFELNDENESQAADTSISSVEASFACEGATYSGVEFDLAASGYNVNFTKKRVRSGRYLVEPDSEVRHS